MINILAIAQVEDPTNLEQQIKKQIIQPDQIIFHIDKNPANTIDTRRKRIADNHKELVRIVEKEQPNYVWQLEQDVILPNNALSKLKDNLTDDMGFISGIQVGRHGLYCLGAWVNFKKESYESLDYKLEGIQEVGATGFYCLLAKREDWLSGKCTWDDEPFGPDVVWSRSILKKKYVDMSLEIGHKVKNGVIMPHHKSTCNAKFFKDNGRWKYKQI